MLIRLLLFARNGAILESTVGSGTGVGDGDGVTGTALNVTGGCVGAIGVWTIVITGSGVIAVSVACTGLDVGVCVLTATGACVAVGFAGFMFDFEDTDGTRVGRGGSVSGLGVAVGVFVGVRGVSVAVACGVISVTTSFAARKAGGNFQTRTPNAAAVKTAKVE